MNETAVYDLEAEEQVIAATLVAEDSAVVPQLTQMLQPADFSEANGWVWAAVCDLFAAGQSVNQITVAYVLKDRENGSGSQLDALGGQAELAMMIRRLVAVDGAKFYAEIVRKAALARRIQQAGSWLISEAQRDPEHGEQLLGRASEMLAKLTPQRRATTRSLHDVLLGEGNVEGRDGVMDEMEMFLADPRAIRGISIGWRELDHMLNGLQPSRVHTIIADTSVGKSMVCHNIAWLLAKATYSTLIISTEMSAEEIATRLVFLEAGMDKARIRRQGAATYDQLDAIRSAEERLMQLPIVINDVGEADVSTVRAEVRRQLQLERCDLVIVDHIQHLRAPGLQGSAQMEAVTGMTKGLAMNHAIPVLQVSHPSRSSSSGTVPLGLHSGKWGSSIEQDTDVFITLEPVKREDGEWVAMSEHETRRQLASDNRVPVRFSVDKNRGEGIRGMHVRMFDWDKGGRFVEMEQS